MPIGCVVPRAPVVGSRNEQANAFVDGQCTYSGDKAKENVRFERINLIRETHGSFDS